MGAPRHLELTLALEPRHLRLLRARPEARRGLAPALLAVIDEVLAYYRFARVWDRRVWERRASSRRRYAKARR